MSDPARSTVSTILQIVQLATLIIGVAGLFLAIGRRDQVLNTNASEIRELREISADMARASIESTMTNRDQDRRLDELRERLARLESRP
jgi:hypothetical protein